MYEQQQTHPQTPTRILRLPDLKEKIRLGRSAIYDMISRGEFPRQVQLSARTSGWLESEVDEWLLQRASLRDGKAAGNTKNAA